MIMSWSTNMFPMSGKATCIGLEKQHWPKHKQVKTSLKQQNYSPSYKPLNWSGDRRDWNKSSSTKKCRRERKRGGWLSALPVFNSGLYFLWLSSQRCFSPEQRSSRSTLIPELSPNTLSTSETCWSLAIFMSYTLFNLKLSLTTGSLFILHQPTVWSCWRT